MATVLIVDDEGKMRSLVGIALSGENLEVAEAACAEDGVALLTRGLKPDVIVSDIRMKNMDGISFLKEVKRLYPEIEFIVMTAF